MTVNEYLDLNYTIILKKDEEGDWIARIQELDGCIADGQTVDQAIGRLMSIQKMWIEMALKHGKDIPLPDEEI